MENISSQVNRYLEYLKSERHASFFTLRNYKHYLTRFLEFLEQYFPTLNSAVQFDQSLLREYSWYLEKITNEKGERLDLRTQSYHLIALRSFIKYLNNIGIRTLSSDNISVPKAKIKEIKFLADSQVTSLLRLAENARDRSIMELILSTGFRVSDLVRLNKENINFIRKEINLFSVTGKMRTIFLSPSVAYWLSRYLEQRKDDINALFIRKAGKKEGSLRLTARSIQRIVEKYVKKAGLPIKATPHSLRHTFAMSLLSGGTPLSAIKNLLGHKNISTTQIYTHVTNPQLREIHKRFHRK